MNRDTLLDIRCSYSSEQPTSSNISRVPDLIELSAIIYGSFCLETCQDTLGQIQVLVKKIKILYRVMYFQDAQK